MQNPLITGTQVAYYNICHRKLWLFSKGISMEHTSELVDIGRLIHNNTYIKNRREIVMDGIKIDMYDEKFGIIHEIKKSKALEQSHFWQLKYYIYYLKKLGLSVEGIIDYPKLKRRERVSITDDDIKKIEEFVEGIKHINSLPNAPPCINKPFCKKCSYYEFCYV